MINLNAKILNKNIFYLNSGTHQKDYISQSNQLHPTNTDIVKYTKTINAIAHTNILSYGNHLIILLDEENTMENSMFIYDKSPRDKKSRDIEAISQNNKLNILSSHN